MHGKTTYSRVEQPSSAHLHHHITIYDIKQVSLLDRLVYRPFNARSVHLQRQGRPHEVNNCASILEIT